MAKTITIIEALQGAGKTSHMRGEAIRNGGLYVFACPTIPLIREQVNFIQANHGGYLVEEVHSQAPRVKNVPDELEYRRDRIVKEGISDAIIYITHEALMSADFSAFAGWHLRIDEVPLAVQSGKVGTRESQNLYDRMLDEQAVIGDWAHYILAKKASHKSLSADDATKSQLEFYKQAQRPTGIFIDKTHWQKCREIEWFSIWSPSYLDALASIHVAASNYRRSLGVRAINAFHPNACNFVVRTLATSRTGQPQIEIFYFTDSHQGTTADWDTSHGRLWIKEIADYLTANAPDLGFWSANEQVYKLMEHRVPGEYISPKSMGINKFRDLNKCAFIYSEKPQLSDKAIKTASGITDDDIHDAREYETIRQFVMRGSIRNIDYSGAYTIYLYAKDQADMVQTHLTNSGFQTATVAQVNLPSVSSFVKPPKSKALSPAEKLERTREQARNRQKKHRDKLKDAAAITRT